MISLLVRHKGLVAVLAAVLASHSLLAVIPPLFSDEAMFWEWSRHPAFGYYAHPPMTGWLIALVTGIFGTWQYTVRLTSIMLQLGTISFLYYLVLDISDEKRAALLSAILYACLPLSVFLGTAITTDSPLIFFFMVATVFVRKAVIERKTYCWYAAAVACGGMMLTKFMAVLFFPGVFLFLLLHPDYRDRFQTKEPYLASGVSLLIFSPFLYWNMTHDWLTFQFNLYQRQKSQGFDLARPLKYVGGQLLAASPVVFALLVVALVILLVRFLKHNDVAVSPRYRDSVLLMLSMTLFPLAFYVPVSFLADVGAHYTAIVYPTAMFLLVTWMLKGGGSPAPAMAGRSKWIYGVAVGSAGLMSAAVFTLVVFPTLLPDRMLYTENVAADAPIASHYFGWEKGGEHVAGIKAEWQGRPEGLFMTSKDYGLAAMMGFYTPGRPQYFLMNVSRSVVHGKSYLLWERGKKRIGANTVYVSDTPESYRSHLTGFFKEIRLLQPLVIRDAQGRILRVFYLAIGVHYLGGEPDNLSLW